jgi:hypothetical protein
MAAYFVVQSFSKGKKGVVTDEPFMAQNINHARRTAERMSLNKLGVVAFMREANVKEGEYGEAKLIAAFGNYPDEVKEMATVQ